ncbi:MAG: TolC family protein, partial [Mariprofundales bacterium]|nr:TolC family protein [Mariprofundales bacterium]
VVAGWSHKTSSQGTFSGYTVKTASIGIELSMPLYAGGATWAQQRKSTKQKIEAEFSVEESKRIARLAARQALLGLRTTAAEVRALSTALQSAKTERRAAQAGFAVGVRTISDALDAEERVATAKQRYADAVARNAMTYLQLLAAGDRLQATAVEIIDKSLTTTQHPAQQGS